MRLITTHHLFLLDHIFSFFHLRLDPYCNPKDTKISHHVKPVWRASKNYQMGRYSSQQAQSDKFYESTSAHLKNQRLPKWSKQASRQKSFCKYSSWIPNGPRAKINDLDFHRCATFPLEKATLLRYQHRRLGGLR